jgi:hypothetical protein
VAGFSTAHCEIYIGLIAEFSGGHEELREYNASVDFEQMANRGQQSATWLRIALFKKGAVS